MQYMLLIYEDEALYEEPGKYEAVVEAHGAFAADLARRGVLRGGAGRQAGADMKAWIVELETRLPARAAEVVALAKTSDQLLRVGKESESGIGLDPAEDAEPPEAHEQ